MYLYNYPWSFIILFGNVIIIIGDILDFNEKPRIISFINCLIFL